MSAPAALTLSRADGIASVVLDRPASRNALDLATFAALRELCARLAADDDVRAVVLTGRGQAFCAGADIAQLGQLVDADVEAFLAVGEEATATIATLFRFPKPLIAAVNGPAAGAGLALALAADIRVAAPAATFSAPFVRLGLAGCDAGVSWLLPRVVGLGNASDLLLTGRHADAAEALRIGLVSRVVAPDELGGAALDVAARLAGHSPFGMRLTKQALHANLDTPSLEAAIELENRNQALASRSPHFARAVAAFLAP